MAFGSSKSPSITDVVQKGSALLEGRHIVNSSPAAPGRRFTGRPKPAPVERGSDPGPARERSEER